jgi:hydroxymethylpyrimidine/phosphomethylpyrimidine kinase
MPVAPPFRNDQIDAMNVAFKQACVKMGLTGSTPVIELVAIRIVELARAGECNPDKLTDTVMATFDLNKDGAAAFAG